MSLFRRPEPPAAPPRSTAWWRRSSEPHGRRALESCIASRGPWRGHVVRGSRANRSHGIGSLPSPPPARGWVRTAGRTGLRSPSWPLLEPGGVGGLPAWCRPLPRGHGGCTCTGGRSSPARAASEPRSAGARAWIVRTLPRAGRPGRDGGRLLGQGIREDLVAFWFTSQ